MNSSNKPSSSSNKPSPSSNKPSPSSIKAILAHVGASLSFWEPPGVQKTLLGSNVKGSGISISVIFFIFLGFLLFLFRSGLLELLGASPGSKKLFWGLMLRVQESQFL